MSRKGRKAAPDISFAADIAGAAARPFRDTRPLLQAPCEPNKWAMGRGLYCTAAKTQLRR
ncbi:hypothetical protein D3C76_1723080 [compost metagenome]